MGMNMEEEPVRVLLVDDDKDDWPTMNDAHRVSVLFETEGTYPFIGGGVFTWCDILVRELPQVDTLSQGQ